MRSGSPDGATEILLERLHYGKLAEAGNSPFPPTKVMASHAAAEGSRLILTACFRPRA